MTDPKPAGYRHIAALGSSFAAGPGIQPLADRGANRSAANYPHILAARLGAQLTDLTISGATTATILHERQRLGLRTFAPQVDGLPPDADLITITAGGNDLRYALSLLQAGWGGWFREHVITRPLGNRLSKHPVPVVDSDMVEQAASGLARVVDEARRRSPHARVMLVDYLTVIGPATEPSPAVPFSLETVTGFREVGRRLNEAFARAAELSEAELVQVSEPSAVHAVGTSEPWVVGFAPTFAGITAFHPNATGMAAVADLVEISL